VTLIVGATGLLGTEIARRLAGRRHRVTGLVRKASDAARVSGLTDLGVQLVEGDLKDKPSLKRACRGASTVVSTASITRIRREGDSLEAVDRQGQLDLVDAARAAGVPRFVYVSVTSAAGEDDPLNAAKLAVERRVRESGMTYTILRPAAFMEIWSSPRLRLPECQGDGLRIRGTANQLDLARRRGGVRIASG
jgi:NADH dehydrogenase